MADNDNPSGKLETTPNGTFEEWFNTQPDDVKTLISNYENGLKSALKSERENTKALSKQISDLQGAADKGSDLQKQLADLQSKLTESERYSSFMDGATGAGCSNPKAAYRIAKADDDMWKRDGSPDWEAIKETAPELFGTKRGKGGAGNGRNEDPDGGAKMHAMDRAIRQRLVRLD